MLGRENLNKHEELTSCVAPLSSMTVNILEVSYSGKGGKSKGVVICIVAWVHI